VLVEAQPSPPAKNSNRWSVRVLDRTGEPLSDVVLAAEPWMPDHAHGPSRRPAVTSDGTLFVIDGIDLFMAGLWRVTLTVDSPAGADKGEFFFCIEG